MSVLGPAQETLQPSRLLRLLLAVNVSQTFFVGGDSFEGAGLIFCGMPLSWDLSPVLLMIRLRLCVLGGKS